MSKPLPDRETWLSFTALLARAVRFLRALPEDCRTPLYLSHHWEIDGQICLVWANTDTVEETRISFFPQEPEMIDIAYATPSTILLSGARWTTGPVPASVIHTIRMVR